jgi:transposase
VAQPPRHAWADDQPLRLVEQTVAKDDPDPKALACYGIIVRTWDAAGQRQQEAWVRCVDGRPVSAITTQFLTWCCEKLERAGRAVLLLVWDNASWHSSAQVRAWLRAHNRHVKHTGDGVRIISCPLPIKSPWLNPMEPAWIHGKRKVAEADRLLTADEMADRIHAVCGCPREAHLRIPDQAA